MQSGVGALRTSAKKQKPGCQNLYDFGNPAILNGLKIIE